jgi:hypothetical protein
MTTNRHRYCDHDATKAARTACRKLRAQGIDTTLGLDDLVANRLARKHTDHMRNCCWHAVMSYLENWEDSRREGCDWAQAEPTPEIVFDGAEPLLDDLCHCDH